MIENRRPRAVSILLTVFHLRFAGFGKGVIDVLAAYFCFSGHGTHTAFLSLGNFAQRLLKKLHVAAFQYLFQVECCIVRVSEQFGMGAEVKRCTRLGHDFALAL